MSNNILYGAAITVATILGMVTLVTKSGIGIIVLTFLFIVMSCAEIYWWSKYQDAAEELKMFKFNYEQASIEARERRRVGLELLASIGKTDANEVNERIKAFLKGQQTNPMCLCGHPQSEHGSIGVCLHVSNCKCVNFKQFRTVES